LRFATNHITNYKRYLHTNRFHLNDKEADNEVYGEGNVYDYGFRIYNPRLGKLLSVDPLTSTFPFLTPYQFAANMPIWAIDIDGLEAMIVNKNECTVTLVVNVYYVTSGNGAVNSAELQEVTESDIINALAANHRQVMIGDQLYTVNIKINHITKDDEGNALTYEKAKQAAKTSSIEFKDKNGGTQIIEDYRIAAVVVNSNVDEKHRNAFENKPRDMAILTRNIKDNDGLYFNEITIRYNNQVGSEKHTQKSFIHEIGHMLGRQSHSKIGITANEDRDVILIPEDIEKFISVGSDFRLPARKGSIE
jgi:RHS repeat-associated protein